MSSSPPRLLRLQSVTSTNEIAARLVEAGDAVEWTVVVAREQTAGRGQHTNRWVSDPGKNLTCTAILRPAFIDAMDQFRIAKLVCLAVADVLEEYGLDSRIKWPNDVYSGEGKIAGVLIRNTLSENSVETTIVGIGLNVNQTDFPAFPVPPASIRSLTGEEREVEEVLDHLLDSLRMRYAQARTDGKTTDTEYLSRLYRLGIWADYAVDGARFTGRIAGVDPSGWLQVEGQDGEVQTYRFKEIRYV